MPANGRRDLIRRLKVKYTDILSTRIRTKGSGPYVLYRMVHTIRTQHLPTQARCPLLGISGLNQKPFLRPCWTPRFLCQNHAEPGRYSSGIHTDSDRVYLQKGELNSQARDSTYIIFTAKQIKHRPPTYQRYLIVWYSSHGHRLRSGAF